jgi:stearoyl-CoA desaturase (Delta-9 desaturase)
MTTPDHPENLAPDRVGGPRADDAGDTQHRVPLGIQFLNLVAVVLPFAGLVVAIVFLWGTGLSWVHLGLTIGMYLITAVGITVGFHRLFTHRSFQTNRIVAVLLGIFGSMAVEGPLLKWVAMHRRHHQHSDDEHDPHSPHGHGGDGLWATLRGLWHAHVGWIFDPDPDHIARYAGDLRRDPALRAVSALFPLWVALGLLLPALCGGLITLSWTGALFGFIWGGLARIFLVHHVTWSVNSVCHLWGSRPFRTRDHSRNNFLFGVLALGEGWHNNHHAFPSSARHGLRWWQIDISYWLIRAMKIVGLASDVKIPAPAALAAKRAGTGGGV